MPDLSLSFLLTLTLTPALPFLTVRSARRCAPFLQSFQRQCNLWGFERLLHGSEKGGYCHPDGFFCRGKRELVSKMVRRKIKRRPNVEGNEEATPASSLILPPQVLAASVMTGTTLVPQQRRPSMVSCSSSQNSVDVFQQPPMVSTGYYEVPASPGTYYGNSSVGTASLTASPAVTDRAEGLYLPPPPPPTVTQEAAVASEPDALFMEGLSAFFEDGADISIVSEEGVRHPTASVPPTTAPSVPAPLPPPPAIQDMEAHKLQPKQQPQHKRRLSLELFVASRQQDSEGVILDLLTGSDSLQRSLEMELMCEVKQPQL